MSLALYTARRQSGAAGEGVGHAEAGIRTFLRPDHREQRPRRNDRPVGGCDRARTHDTSMGTRLLGLLTAVVADSSDRYCGLQRLVAGEVMIIWTTRDDHRTNIDHLAKIRRRERPATTDRLIKTGAHVCAHVGPSNKRAHRRSADDGPVNERPECVTIGWPCVHEVLSIAA